MATNTASMTAFQVASEVKCAADYGGQIAAVFHTFSLSAEKVPEGQEGSINILGSTVTILKQAVELLNQEASGNDPRLFSEEGISYVYLLTRECATALAKIEPLLARASLTPKQAREKRISEKKNSVQSGLSVSDSLGQKLDVQALLKTLEMAKWSRISTDMAEIIERLYDIQLHLLLVLEVVKVGALSRDL